MEVPPAINVFYIENGTVPSEVLKEAESAFPKAVMHSAYLFAQKAKKGEGGLEDLRKMEKMPLLPQELRDAVAVIAENAAAVGADRLVAASKPRLLRLARRFAKPGVQELPAGMQKLLPGRLRY